MVFFFTSSEGHTIYMGKDKFENEDLIRYGFLEDVWFHVDDLSSAHVYLRLPMGQAKVDDISELCLEECAQLVKENSIEGCKRKSVNVVYTKWRNLKKTPSMEVGQVGFNHPDRVRMFTVEEKNKDIIKALNKTKTEAYPDLEADRVGLLLPSYALPSQPALQTHSLSTQSPPEPQSTSHAAETSFSHLVPSKPA